MDLEPPGTRIEYPDDAYNTDQKVLARGPTPLGTPGVLPYELRCMIYKSLFLAESTCLTRVSKKWAADTKESMKKYYEFHTTMQWDRERDMFRSELGSRPIPADLALLTIHIILSRTCNNIGGERELRDLIRQVVDRARLHLNCHVSIELLGIKLTTNFRWVYALEPLRKFKAVTVGVESGVLRNRDVALEVQWIHHVERRYYHTIVATIQSYPGPLFKKDRTLKIVGHTFWYVASDGWVKALKDREEDECIDYRFPRLGAEFPGCVAYGHCWASDLVLLPVEDGSREILRARNGNHNGLSIGYFG